MAVKLSEETHAAAKELRETFKNLMATKIPDPAMEEHIIELSYTAATSLTCAEICAMQFPIGSSAYKNCVTDTCDDLQARIQDEEPNWKSESAFWKGVEKAATDFTEKITITT